MSTSATASLTRRGLAPRRPMPREAPTDAGIVHLGLGAFHRAHQAVYTALALEREPGPWGIVGVARHSRRVTEAMRAQDSLYSILELGPAARAPLVVGVHTQLLVAADEPLAVVAQLADADTRIATLTVTEQGYTARPGTAALDPDHPAVRADLAGAPPRTTIGLLARGLQERQRRHGTPMAIVSCDNVEHNGEHTRALVVEFAGLLPEPEGSELRAWIERSIDFPSTMVDRMVPAPNAAHRARVAEWLGFHDAAAVAAEPFCMWVLEDRFRAGRPAWEAAGAIFSADVQRYEQLKLRLLNATHSLIAYLALLAGERTIADAVARPEIRRVAEHAVYEELLPTLDPPPEVDVPRYVERLFGRLTNAALEHRACQVASDGSLKLPVRTAAAVLYHADSRRVPRAIALTFAAFVRCVATPDAYDARRLGTATDPQRERLENLGRRASGSRELVGAAFELGILPPALARNVAFVDAVAELHEVLVDHGHEAAIDAATR